MSSLAALSTLSRAEIVAKREGNQVIVRKDDRVVLVYQADPGPLPREDLSESYRRGGYIATLRTLAGVQVTDDFPPDHPHHHGVWSPWTKTRFQGRTPDFWNMGEGTGRVEFVELKALHNRGTSAGFEARHRFVDLSAEKPVTALWETWTIEVSAPDHRVVVDFTSTQTCATESPLILPEHRYGGFGFRGNRAWNGEDGCDFLAATGETDRLKIENTRQDWCWIGGAVGDRTAGVYILCHPENFRAPQPIRAHPEQPFFCYSPPKAGEMSIRPDEPYVARYRLIIADGVPDAEAAETWWKEYRGDE
ncbi:MAG: PmoA family protein [Verrucomicrobiae bacterium]|nr:PmoA family protein [Verrucomicrobiae bacterium]